MNVKTRSTAQGTEYWDAKEKRIRFVPAGQDPDFEVTENPKSMVMGVDLATGKENTVTPFGVSDEEKNYQLSEMTIKELRALAADKEISIPSEVTKRDDIAKHIFENWSAATEE